MTPFLDLLAGPATGKLFAAMLAVPFLVSAVSKAVNFQTAVEEVGGLVALPAAPVAALVIATQAAGGIALIGGGLASVIGALALAGFTALATVLAHAWWSRPRGMEDPAFIIFW